MNKRSKFSQEEFKNEAINLYNKGLKAKEIAVILKISKTAVITNFKKLGYLFDRSVSMQKYNLDIDYFKNIDTEDKAYWLGLIYADGCNKLKLNTFTLGLKQEDSYLLEIFKNCLNYNNSIKIENDRRGNRKPFHVLAIYNKKFCNNLLNHGVFENKTFILNKPDIHKNFHSHFIRGYFDGDGGVVTTCNLKKHYKDSINFTGTLELLSFIKEYFNNKGVNVYTEKRHKDRDNNNYTIKINGRLNVIKACEIMYLNSNYKMIRKHEKFLKIKNRYE